MFFCFYCYGDHRYLHVLTHSFPTRRSSDLFGTGNRSVGADESNLLWTGDYALVASGIGPWGQSGIDQITNGRQIELNFAIDDDAFELAAESRDRKSTRLNSSH